MGKRGIFTVVHFEKDNDIGCDVCGTPSIDKEIGAYFYPGEGHFMRCRLGLWLCQSCFDALKKAVNEKYSKGVEDGKGITV